MTTRASMRIGLFCLCRSPRSYVQLCVLTFPLCCGVCSGFVYLNCWGGMSWSYFAWKHPSLIWVDVALHAESGFVCSAPQLPDFKLGAAEISVFLVKKTRVLDHGHVYIPARLSAPAVQDVGARLWFRYVRTRGGPSAPGWLWAALLNRGHDVTRVRVGEAHFSKRGTCIKIQE